MRLVPQESERRDSARVTFSGCYFDDEIRRGFVSGRSRSATVLERKRQGRRLHRERKILDCGIRSKLRFTRSVQCRLFFTTFLCIKFSNCVSNNFIIYKALAVKIFSTLPAYEQDLVKCAALIGRIFYRSTLEAIVPRHDPLKTASGKLSFIISSLNLKKKLTHLYRYTQSDEKSNFQMCRAAESLLRGRRNRSLLFEIDDYFLGYASLATMSMSLATPSTLFKILLDEKHLEVLEFLQQRTELNIHRIFIDGKSAIHYLFSLYYKYESGLRNDNHLIDPTLDDLKQERKSSKYHAYDDPETKFLINFFLKNSEENHCDDHGYSYLHGACFSGDIETVKRFVSQGADVNVDSYTCSPLHIACKYRRVDVVKVLLESGAEPNPLNKEDKSTPLHALARLRVCDCPEFCTDNIDDDKKEKKRRPVDEIVDSLVAKGANIETRNARGFTPLELAVSLLDYELTKSLLERGASLDSLRKNIAFSTDYTTSELNDYPITFYIAEMIRLLSSNGLSWDVYPRLKISKFNFISTQCTHM
ncbi:unnamed protein product [Trichogramma brassicae]|uniref:Uncharacterized protein n=1 Tax=Trichogramma brassicae TaxID=86971 RepID=A0A6H5IWC3_9HYME|nr:unnamed protein product [Trichogramma brassicae]